ncbi:hypothetical protein MCHIJ_18310 [Mycolicibacterium chitae]|nr:hypothetical protein MCHIJ_18310 [Mycolicibacterium chitae]
MATFGLGRIEDAIDAPERDDQVAVLLERAAAVARSENARVRVPVAPSGPYQLDDEPDLPTRIYHSVNPNPQFQPTRQANRV